MITSLDNIDDDNVDPVLYDCNICLDTAFYPVLITCGHLYCWTCLAVWIKTLKLQEQQVVCPVCKKKCNEKENIIPVYGREDQTPKNYDLSLFPKRPAGKRPEVITYTSHGYPHYDQLATNSTGFRIFSRNIIISSAENRVLPTFYFIDEIPPSIIIEIGQLGFLSRLLLMIICLHVVVSIFY